MKSLLSKTIAVLLSTALFSCVLPLNTTGQIWKGTGFAYTRNMPTHNPGMTGAWVAIDSLSGDWYEWSNSTQAWREMGDRVQFTYTSGAPSWVPTKQRSRLVLNAGDSLYAYQAGVWTLINAAGFGSNNTALVYTGDTLYLTDAGGTLTAYIPQGGADTSGYNSAFTRSNDTLYLTDGAGTLFAALPPVVDTSGRNQSLIISGDTLYITDDQGTLGVPLPPVSDTSGYNYALTISNDTLSIVDGQSILFAVLPTPLDTSGYNQSMVLSNDTLYLTDGQGTLSVTFPVPLDTSGYNLSFFRSGDSLFIQDGAGTLSLILPQALDTSGYNQTLLVSGDTLFLTDGQGTVFAVLPPVTDTSGYNSTMTVSNDTLFLTDGQGTLYAKLPRPSIPANLVLYATTQADTAIVGYNALVTDLNDAWYDDPAVDVPVGPVTTTAQLLASLTTAPGIIEGNPGIINVETIGQIRRTSGTGGAEFYFEVYQRDYLGNETLVATSDKTQEVTTGSFAEFQATAMLNNGNWLSTDRIVLKYYADRVPGGSDPTYQFRFGGDNPVRTLFPVPASVLVDVPVKVGVTEVQNYVPNIVLKANASGILDTTNITAANGQVGINTAPSAALDVKTLSGDILNLRDTSGTVKWAAQQNGTLTNNSGTSITNDTVFSQVYYPSNLSATVEIITRNTIVGQSLTPYAPITGSVGTFNQFRINGTFNGMSGMEYNVLTITPTIAPSSGNPFVRGIYVSPSNPGTTNYRGIEFDTDYGFSIYSSGLAKTYLEGQVGIGTDSPNPDALLHLRSTTKGLFVPRVSTTNRNAMTNAQGGFQIFNTTAGIMQHYDGTTWISEVDTSTTLESDTVLVYRRNGIEFARDTIRAKTKFGSGTTNTLAMWSADTLKNSGVVSNGTQILFDPDLNGVADVTINNTATTLENVTTTGDMSVGQALSIGALNSANTQYLAGWTSALQATGITLGPNFSYGRGATVDTLKYAVDSTVFATRYWADATFLKTEVDGSVTNEIQSLSVNGDSLFISSGNYVILPPTNVDSSVFATLYALADTAANIRQAIPPVLIKEDTTKVQAYTAWPSDPEILMGIDPTDSTVTVYAPSVLIPQYETDGDDQNELQTIDRVGNYVRLNDNNFFWAYTQVPVLGGDSTYIVDTSRVATKSWASSTFLTTEVDGVIGNEYQQIDTFAVSGDSIFLSLTNDGQAKSFVLSDNSKTNELQNISISNDGETLTLTNGNSATFPVDTVTLATFGGGSGVARDTSIFTTSAIYGSFYNDGTDTLVVTKMLIVLQGTSPSVNVALTWNDTLNVTGTSLVTAGTTATNTSTGVSVTSFDNTKIPPGNWVWAKTGTVTTKPTYLSISIIGYRKRKV